MQVRRHWQFRREAKRRIQHQPPQTRLQMPQKLPLKKPLPPWQLRRQPQKYPLLKWPWPQRRQPLQPLSQLARVRLFTNKLARFATLLA